MNVPVLLNLLNELRKRDRLSLFRNEFNKFINTEARTLDSVKDYSEISFLAKKGII